MVGDEALNGIEPISLDFLLLGGIEEGTDPAMTRLGLGRCTSMRPIRWLYLDLTDSNAELPGCVWNTVQSAYREIDIQEGLLSYDLRWQLRFVNDFAVDYYAAILQLVAICIEVQVVDVARGEGRRGDDPQERAIAAVGWQSEARRAARGPAERTSFIALGDAPACRQRILIRAPGDRTKRARLRKADRAGALPFHLPSPEGIAIGDRNALSRISLDVQYAQILVGRHAAPQLGVGHALGIRTKLNRPPRRPNVRRSRVPGDEAK